MTSPPLPSGRFGVIYADPPWKYQTYNKAKSVPSRTALDPYVTMSKEELKALPIQDVAAKDCVLIMWIVSAHLEEALALAKAWGFTFKTDAFFWDKAQMGMGKWTRKEGEIALLFTRGKPKVLSHGVRQIIRAPRREHSRKPDEAYARIMALAGGPYLELFARQTWPGWTSWGNQTETFETPSGAPLDGV